MAKLLLFLVELAQTQAQLTQLDRRLREMNAVRLFGYMIFVR